MNWLFPGFLTGGVLIGLPVLLHFLRSKPKTIVRFPSLRFLGASALHDTRKHRLRRLITLLLRALVIGLLAAAFARPFWKSEQASQRRVMVVAVDNSMSMQASGRWEQAREWALAQLDTLEAGDEAGIVLMNPTPTWMAPVTDDVARVRSVLREALPGFETTRYSGALRMAGEALAANPARTKILVWMADEQRLGWLGTAFDQPLPPGVTVRLGDTAPAPGRQAAMASLRWLADPGGMVLEAGVRLYAPDTDKRHVTVRSVGQDGGEVLAEQEITLRAGTENKIRLPLKLPAGKQIDGVRVSIDADDLPADDTAWLDAAPRTAAPVLLESATGGADFLADALASTHKLTEGALEVAPLPDGEWPVKSVAILRGADCFGPPRVAQLNRFVAAGGPLWIFVDGSVAQTSWLKEHGVTVTERPASETATYLRDWDSDQPILAAFANQSLLPLMQIEFYRGYGLAGDHLEPFAKWGDGAAAIAELNSGGHRIFLCGFPLDRAATNWPVQPTFVPFVHQTVRWLASLSETRTDWRVGNTIPLPSPAGVWRAIDSARPMAERKVAGSVRPDAPGLYEYVDGGKRQLFAVNVPIEESDLAPWPDRGQLVALESKVKAPSEDVAQGAGMLPSDEAAESQQRLWWWLLAICGVGMLGELALANRTAM